MTLLLLSLPDDILVRVLIQLELEMLSRCAQLSRLFHRPNSPLEQALRELASGGGIGVPHTLPSNHANWTQALLFLAAVRRAKNGQLAAGWPYYSAFVDADRTLLMRGHGNPGVRFLGKVLGPEALQSIPMPVARLAGVRVASIATYVFHILVVSVDGRVFSWGRNRSGALGHGDRKDVTRPKLIGGVWNVCAISTHEYHTLAITTDGAVWSWGANRYWGILGHGDTDESVKFELRPRRIVALAGMHTCAVAAGSHRSLAATRTGSCFSWGYCHLRRKDEMSKPHRVRQLDGEHVISVGTSAMRSCAITARGELWRWGQWDGVALAPTPLTFTRLTGRRVSHTQVSRPFFPSAPHPRFPKFTLSTVPMYHPIGFLTSQPGLSSRGIALSPSLSPGSTPLF